MKEESSMKGDCCEKGSEGGSAMQYIVLGLVVLLLVVSLVQAFEISGIKNGVTGGVVAQTGDSAYEQMMAEMHPDAAGSQAGTDMVGGC